MSMHFLPQQHVERNYEARLVLRGDDLQMLREVLTTDPNLLSFEQHYWIDDVLLLTQPVITINKVDPFAAHVTA